MKEFKAGSAVSDITPEMGIQLAGDIGRHRPTEEIRDRLHSRALVIDNGDERVCVISTDLLAINGKWSDEIRKRCSEGTGLKPENIMLHVTQNHAAPCIGHFFYDDSNAIAPEYSWLMGGDDRYNEPAAEAIVDSVARAVKNMQNVNISVCRGIDGRVAFNRRFVMRDGTALCHPPHCDPNILHAEGPTDPEVGILRFADENDRDVALLLHHTCHPCNGYPERFVISDWPGAWSENMSRNRDGVALVLNGCCGNIHHANHIAPGHKSDYKRMGEQLAETSIKALESQEPLQSRVLSVAVESLSLPYRKPPENEVKAARELLAANPDPMWLDEQKTRVSWDWVFAGGLLEINEKAQAGEMFQYEVQVFRIGDVALVALMGEPFVEAQLRIKKESPVKYTFVGHFCHGYAGYLPTPRAFEGGGYETRTGSGSQFCKDALEKVGDTALRLLHQVF